MGLKDAIIRLIKQKKPIGDRKKTTTWYILKTKDRNICSIQPNQEDSRGGSHNIVNV